MKDTQEADSDFVIISCLCFNKGAKNSSHCSAREVEQSQKEIIITGRINTVCVFISNNEQKVFPYRCRNRKKKESIFCPL